MDEDRKSPLLFTLQSPEDVAGMHRGLMPLHQGRDEKKLPLTSPPQKQRITSSQGEGQAGFPERLKPSCILLCLVLDPVLLRNATKTKNSFPPGEFTKHKSRRQTWGTHPAENSLACPGLQFLGEFKEGFSEEGFS